MLQINVMQTERTVNIICEQISEKGVFHTVEFGLVALSRGKDDELCFSLCCTLIVAPIPEIHSLKVQNTLCAL